MKDLIFINLNFYYDIISPSVCSIKTYHTRINVHDTCFVALVTSQNARYCIASRAKNSNNKHKTTENFLRYSTCLIVYWLLCVVWTSSQTVKEQFHGSVMIYLITFTKVIPQNIYHHHHLHDVESSEPKLLVFQIACVMLIRSKCEYLFTSVLHNKGSVVHWLMVGRVASSHGHHGSYSVHGAGSVVSSTSESPWIF